MLLAGSRWIDDDRRFLIWNPRMPTRADQPDDEESEPQDASTYRLIQIFPSRCGAGGAVEATSSTRSRGRRGARPEGGRQAETEEHDWAVGRALGKDLLELAIKPIEQPPMSSIQPLATDQAPSQEEKCVPVIG